jgi:hypothetical protein
MKKVLFLAIVAAGLYFAWSRFRPVPDQRAGSGDRTPAANAAQRIDTLSGAAPQDH